MVTVPKKFAGGVPRFFFFTLAINVLVTSILSLTWIWVLHRYPDNSRFLLPYLQIYLSQ
jgi:hypothetical protein